MSDVALTQKYSPAEEAINIWSHAVGCVLSVVALLALIARAMEGGEILHIVSSTIFGLSLILLYATSAVYHSTVDPDLRSRRRVVDHCSIYVLIAGTYTPFTLIVLPGFTGWLIFGISWSMAVTGIVLKYFFTGKFRLLSTLMYVFMGWMIVFAISPLIDNLSSDGMFWLVAGGASYTVGAVLYAIKKIPFNHAIFHLFVLSGSVCHFMAVYFYVI